MKAVKYSNSEYEIVKSVENGYPHYEIYKDGKFISSEDTEKEAKREVERLESKISEGVYNMKIIEAVDPEIERRVKNNPTFKKIDSICKKYGYKLYYAVMYSYGPRVDIVRPRGGYQPEVYFDYSDVMGRTGEDAWSIQTTSYGSLEPSEYKKFIEGCNAAYKMVQELAKVNLSKLEFADWAK